MFIFKALYALVAFRSVFGQAINNASLPTKYGIIVFPGFQALDVFGPLDVMNTVAAQSKINLSIIASTYDPVSTHSDLFPGIGSTFNEHVVPTHTFDNPPEDLDVLLVPGGGGTRAELLDAIKYIKDIYPSLQYLFSVCTGASLLARAGVLDGRRATTNKKDWAWATSTGPNVTWVPVARWVVDGNIWTTSGIAAGLDGIYAYVNFLYGPDFATNIANYLEYERHLNSSDDPFAAIWNVPGATRRTILNGN
jgi:transcriptional regulator GlxA family with amidase domain